MMEEKRVPLISIPGAGSSFNFFFFFPLHASASRVLLCKALRVKRWQVSLWLLHHRVPTLPEDF